MKKVAHFMAWLVVLGVTSLAHAGSVTQAVFSITSSAKTSTPNLRVQTMKSMWKDANGQLMPFFIRSAGVTDNRYLTKTQPVDLTNAVCLYIEVDQDTLLKLNSETAYIKIPSGTREFQCFR